VVAGTLSRVERRRGRGFLEQRPVLLIYPDVQRVVSHHAERSLTPKTTANRDNVVAFPITCDSGEGDTLAFSPHDRLGEMRLSAVAILTASSEGQARGRARDSYLNTGGRFVHFSWRDDLYQ
jgi:hypothetical protein